MTDQQEEAVRNAVAAAWVRDVAKGSIFVDQRMLIVRSRGTEIAPFGHKRLRGLVAAGLIAHTDPDTAAAGPIGHYQLIGKA